MAQKKLRTEVIQLEDALGQVRKAYEMLRIEFEQTLAAHEQTGRPHCGRKELQKLQNKCIFKWWYSFASLQRQNLMRIPFKILKF